MGENGKNMEIMGSFTQAVFILSNEIEEKQWLILIWIKLLYIFNIVLSFSLNIAL